MRTILALAIGATAFQTSTRRTPARVSLNAAPQEGDLSGKVAFVAGVADSTGYGWAIAKSLAEAGCKIIVGTWPPVLAIFKKSLEGGKMDADRELSGGRTMDIDKIYPLDAAFDTPEDVPEELRESPEGLKDLMLLRFRSSFWCDRDLVFSCSVFMYLLRVFGYL